MKEKRYSIDDLTANDIAILQYALELFGTKSTSTIARKVEKAWKVYEKDCEIRRQEKRQRATSK